MQTAQYLPDDPAEPAWSPTVEIAVHAGGRYRLIGLTPEEARELAAMLAKAADITAAITAADIDSGRHHGGRHHGAHPPQPVAGPAGSRRAASRRNGLDTTVSPA